MAAHGWRSAPSVEDELFASGYRFDFFQAMRLLKLLEHREREGRDPPPQPEPVRLRAAMSMAFPASDLVEVKRPEAKEGEAGQGMPELTAAFFALGGALGPLPGPYSQQLVNRVRSGSRGKATRDFLDIFHHRLLSLFYRGRQLRRVWLEEGPPEQYAVTRYLYALLGLGTPRLSNRLEVEDRVLLRYAGLLIRRPMSSGALEAMLTDWLGVEVRPRLPRGAWLELGEEQTTRLGALGQNQRLGQGAVLGTRAWHSQAGLELELGPLSWRRYLDLLPGSPGLSKLRSLTRFALGPIPDVGLVLKPRPEDIQEQPLRTHGGPRLGWTTWLRARPGHRGPQTVALSPRHMRTRTEKEVET
ncbi:type VI secretion system baseplate subunit TssG [Archangium lansingense]|uniref:type VI secretion system baseplate subunit TssG n=1 Tax=Archangium lansingense TaxID=2995310 RepID=UPI003B7B7B9C